MRTDPSQFFTGRPGFLWGASTAAHQIEGQNTSSDWWHLEHTPGSFVAEPSGDAADSFHRWPQDMDLLVDLGLTDYRFSVEWARIEPEEGHFSAAAVAHYRAMVEGARARGLRPMVTLHHFTLPQWLATRGGWLAQDAVDRFERYVRQALPVIATDVEHVCTINEPNMVAMMGAILSLGTEVLAEPGLPLPDPLVTERLIEAHHRICSLLRAELPHVRTGWSIANQAFTGVDVAQSVVDEYAWPREDVFISAAADDDWIGVQSYSRVLIGPDGPLPVPADAEVNLNGTEYHPRALGEAVRHTATLLPSTPVVVTENGLCTADDDRRIAALGEGLQSLGEAMADGVDVRGYFHWSLLDNYEWGSYRPTFGLVAVDRGTFVRTPKPSAAAYSRIVRAARGLA